MGEYIVDVGNADEEYIEHFGYMATAYADNPIRELIVRCRDCKYTLHFWHHDDERWQCTNEMLEGLDVSPSFYCAWGERREQ